MKTVSKFFLAVILILAFAISALAQGGATGAITGVVEDSSGAKIPLAKVHLVNTSGAQTERNVQTDSNGSFTSALLPSGNYELTVDASGFATGKFSDIQVRVTEITRLTAMLRPKTAEQQIEVTAQVASVETTTATTGQSVIASTIRALPLATQNFQQLLTLSAGTNSSLNASASLGRGDVRIEVNGQREDNNNYLIEGISASDYNVAELTNTPLPSPDVVQEFKVQTSLYDATQGRNGGGNINAILKTGTKKFHGSVFEFFRNDVLNANEFFLKRQGQPRPSVKQNIFGASLGGPVGKEGRLGFFFVNYQGTRQRSGLSPGTLIGTSFPVLPVDRSTASLSTAFFGNPNVPIDPVTLKLLNLSGNQFGNSPGGFLIPSLTGAIGGTAPLNTSHPGKYNDDQFTTNYDKDFRQGADKISGRFFFSNFESLLPFGAGGLQASLGGGISPSDLNFPLDLPVRDRFLNVTETHVFGPRLVNEFRLGYVRINNQAINVPIAKANDLGISRPNSNVDNLIYKFTFNSSGFQIGPTPTADQSQIQNNYTFLNTTSYSAGKHFVRFGGEYDRVNLNKNFPQVFNGQLFFSPSNAASNPACAVSAFNPSGGCSDFQNFLLGAPSFSFGGSGVSNHEYRINNYAFFLQEDYKATPNLTINAGVRWELTGAVRDNLNHIGNTVAALARAGQSPYIFPKGVNKFNVPGLVGTTSPTTLNNDYASNWGPRIGFAYDPFGNHTTAIRGGYGIFYVREDVGTVDQMSFTTPILPITFASGPPGTMATLFATGPGRLPVGGVIDPAFVPVYSQFQGFVDGSGNPTTNTTQTAVFGGNTINLFGLEVPRHFVTPSTQQWNLSIQQQLPGNWVAEVAYVGTKGTHLRETRDAIQAVDARINPVNLTAANGAAYTITQNTAANLNARSRAIGLAPSGYQLFASDAWSNYHSLQTTLSRRFASGLHFQAAYTFSRAHDATSSGNTAFNTAVNDQTNLRDSYGLADFDRTHRLIINYSYDLPFFNAATGLKGALLAHWTMSGITTFQSGTPFTIIDSAAASAFGLLGTGTPTTPNLAPGATVGSGVVNTDLLHKLDGYINPAAFVAAGAVGPDGSTGFGNLGRNTYRGPFQQNWDYSLGKIFKIRESQQFKFTADFFNIFNHPNFSNPSGLDIESPGNFGHITTTQGTPRLIQFSARYAF